MTVDELLDELQTREIQVNTRQRLEKQNAIAKEKNVPLIAYEGGQTPRWRRGREGRSDRKSIV